MPLMQDMGQKQLKTVGSNHDFVSIFFQKRRVTLVHLWYLFDPTDQTDQEFNDDVVSKDGDGAQGG